MNVLGIADNHDSGAALVVDDKLVAAVNQERVDRVKNSGAFPWGAIDAVLHQAGLRERDIDRIVVGTGFTPATILRALPQWHHQRRSDGQFSPLLHGYFVYQSALRKLGLHALEVDASKALLQKKFEERPFGSVHVEMMDHHRAHAQGAYRTQAHDHCLVLTVDAMGDGTSATASLGRNGQLDQLYRQSGLACVNTFYSRITELLGFRPNRHEGKITGLAAYAPPPPALLAHMRQRMRFEGPGFLRLPALRVDRKDDPYWSEIARWPREEVAASAQRVLEEAVVSFVDHWVRHTGCGHVAVAGGVFANVKLNQRICELDNVDHLWVFPHMGDGGLAAGGALGSAGAAPTPLPDAYLGPDFVQRDLYKALKRGGMAPHERAAETAPSGQRGDVEQVAAMLASGRVVARFGGRMEWGPRALGNRTVLARPHDPTINDWLNKKLKRSEFMPFAPICREEDAERWFKGTAKARAAARFMTVCFDVTQAFKDTCPAAVHVDGTARPQLLRREDNPALHDVLTRVGELCDTPVLINTSFNLHEEPIVCTPSDAVRAYQQAELDGLWIGPYVDIRARFAQQAS